MFRKSRIRIVTVMMSVLLLLFIGTVCVIYFSSYAEVFTENKEMLSRYAQAYWKNGNPSENSDLPPIMAGSDRRREHTYRLSSFHSVLFSQTGEILNIDNDTGMGVSEEELTELAERLIDKNKSSGVSGSWVYLVDHNQGCTLVVVIDNTIMSDSISTLLRYTVLFGCITIVLLFVMSFYFARYIVHPLEESYQKQKQFISDAGHELKTPIAVVSTNLELLEREFGESKWSNNVKFEMERMSRLVYQLLELAKAESAEPQMIRLDFYRLVTGGVLPFESVAFETGRELRMEVEDNIYVMGNPEQLGNLVSILVDNALHYAPEHSVISVLLKSERGRAVLSVSNEGEIPEEQIKKLFDRFYRADSSRGGENLHYGLGLAIAKAVVTTHHGKIDVSCKENQVIFSVSLPVNS